MALLIFSGFSLGVNPEVYIVSLKMEVYNMQVRQRKNKNNRNRKQTNKADLKSTMCSNCRYKMDKETGIECYKRHWLLDGMEYIDCIPAFVHWKDRDLAPYMK